ncbi:Dynamin family-domain-containing protein [Lentinula edodes]|nr:Dynamin family-domain-containing protein [Lentinula edodes]
MFTPNSEVPAKTEVASKCDNTSLLYNVSKNGKARKDDGVDDVNETYKTILARIAELEDVLDRTELGLVLLQDGQPQNKKVRVEGVDVWRREIRQIRAQAMTPTLIAVTGATGAGKSTLLNALLDRIIVPTSGMRACTSVATKISYHSETSITAAIDFLTREEWAIEIQMGLGDIKDKGEEKENDNLEIRANAKGFKHGKKRAKTREQRGFGMAWDKIHAVYPNLSPDEFAKFTTAEDVLSNSAFDGITKRLGTSETITCDTSAEFAKAISIYIDAKPVQNQSSHRQPMPSHVDGAESTLHPSGALWPLVREVHIRCNAKCLSTGATLVDLPGIGDSNAARSAVAERYLAHCDCVWVVAPIHRAVNDEHAKELLDRAFKTQLLTDGKLRFVSFTFAYTAQPTTNLYIKIGRSSKDSITFIASKCDDILVSEAIENLDLANTTVLRQFNHDIEQKESELSHYEKILQESWFSMSGSPLNEELFKRRAQLFQTTPIVPSQPTTKRSSDVPNFNTGPNKKIKCEFVLASSSAVSDSTTFNTSQLSHDLNLGTQTYTQNNQAMRKVDVNDPQVYMERQDKYIEGLRKELMVLQQGRDDFITRERNETFKQQLREDVYCELEDIIQDASVMNTDGFDFPVFTCSSRNYLKIKDSASDERCGHLDIVQTEIPLLQEWIHQITNTSHQKELGLMSDMLNTLAQAVKTFCQDNAGGLTTSEQTAIKQKWRSKVLASGKVENPEAIAVRLQKILSPCVESISFYQVFQENLEQDIRQAAMDAASEVLELYESIVTESKMHGNTYRAVIRHHGEFNSSNGLDLDLNQILTSTMKEGLAQSWAAFFNKHHFDSLESDVISVIGEFLVELSNEVTLSPIKSFLEKHKDGIIEKARILVRHAIRKVQRQIDQEQKGVGRGLGPQIQKLLMATYIEAGKISGKGCAQAQKKIMHGYIDEEANNLFEGLAKFLIEGVKSISREVEKCMKADCSHLAQKVEFTVAELWKPDHKALPLQVRAALSDVERVADGITQMLARQMMG